MDSNQQQNRHSNLLTCNHDVFRLIVEFSTLSQHDHLALCLAHPVLRRRTEPILYSNISLGNWTRIEKDPKIHPIARLLHTILVARPGLALHVKAIDLDGSHLGPHQYDPELNVRVPNIDVSDIEMEALVAFVRQKWAHMPFSHSWISQLRRKRIDAYLALLLISAPHLRHLRLARDYFLISSCIGQVLRFAISEHEPVLEHLQTVTLERREWRRHGGRERNTADVTPFFYPQQVKELSIWIDDPQGPDIDWPSPSPPLSPNLVSLRFYGVRESHLGQILSVTPKLRSLCWEWHFEPEREDEFNTPRADLDLIMPALAKVKDTLTMLTIEGSCGYPNAKQLQGRLCVVGAPAAALSGFLQLKKLVVPLALFTGITFDDHAAAAKRLESSLPPTLEALGIRKDLLFDVVPMHDYWDEVDSGYLPTLKLWFDNVSQTLPLLRKLVIDGVELYCEDCNGDYEACVYKGAMLESALQAGIDLKFTDDDEIIL